MTEPMKIHYRQCADRVPNDPCICNTIKGNHMNPFQEAVQEFHLKTGGRGSIYFRDGQRLRARLIMEEAVETVAALGFDVDARVYDNTDHAHDTLFRKYYPKMDLLDFIDGLCDLAYVVAGGAVNADIDLQHHFDEVHRANMRKLEGPKRADGKQLKPEGWVGPDHQRILDFYIPVSEQRHSPYGNEGYCYCGGYQCKLMVPEKDGHDGCSCNHGTHTDCCNSPAAR